MEYLKEEKTTGQKILFTGLDDAGKTSIILALQREFSKIAILSPTRGAQRKIFEFLGKEISEWDLGGQMTYRISYLKNPNKYFANTEIVIYVIDIQNEPRIPEAISYLKDVVYQFLKLPINPPIYVFFHKYDPVLIRNKLNNFIALTEKSEETMRNELNYEKIYFYNTSIYDFSTIMHAMSEILLELYPKAQLIEKTIKEFANKINSEGLMIIDENSLIIGSFYKDEKIKKILDSATPYFLTLNDSFKLGGGSEELRQDQDQILVQRANRYILFKQIILKTGFSPYYVILTKKGQFFYKDDFSSLINLLGEIIFR